MTLQPALIAYLDGQIAAGLAPEQIRSMLRDALGRWGAETDLEEIVSYLYERLRDDRLWRETLRSRLARSLAEDDPIEMPAEMDARIRQRLFGTSEKSPLPPPVNRGGDPSSARPASYRLPTSSPAIVNPGRDHPHFESYAVDPDWEKVGPVLSRLVWLAREHELAWEASAGDPRQPDARRRAILWRALVRAGHLDFTALTELQDYQDMQPLDPDILTELDDLQSKFRKMLDGIQGLLDTARVKEPYA